MKIIIKHIDKIPSFQLRHEIIDALVHVSKLFCPGKVVSICSINTKK